jgi:hypothetical protein
VPNLQILSRSRTAAPGQLGLPSWPDCAHAKSSPSNLNRTLEIPSTIPPLSETGPAKGPVAVNPHRLLAKNAAAFAMMNGTDLKKAAINQAKKVATTAALAANGNGQKKRRKGDNLKPIITTDSAASSNLHDSPTQADPE